MLLTDFYQNPFAEIRKIQREMNDLFQNFGSKNYYNYSDFPLVNVWTKGDDAMVVAEVPGVSPEKIDLQVKDNILTLAGTREAECKQGDNVCYHRQERNIGNFKRVIRLPFRINPQEVKAEYQRGILTIRLKRAEEDKPKKIQIKS